MNKLLIAVLFIASAASAHDEEVVQVERDPECLAEQLKALTDEPMTFVDETQACISAEVIPQGMTNDTLAALTSLINDATAEFKATKENEMDDDEKNKCLNKVADQVSEIKSKIEELQQWIGILYSQTVKDCSSTPIQIASDKIDKVLECDITE